MNVGWVEMERRGAAPGSERDSLDERSGRRWQRQLDDELANHSVCRAIELGGAALSNPAPESGIAAAGKDNVGSTPSPDEPRAQAAGIDRGTLARQALAFRGQAAVARSAAAASYGLSGAPLELSARAEETGAAERISMASDAETMLRSWLKPCKITVFADQGQLRVWVRDARMDAGEAEALGQRLERHIREKGGRLAMLAVNGAVVYSNAAAGLNVLK
ncbi:hypothetical protein [Chromobacterium vaccinii]|uniref:hypothetical protein n=1 Tax=Chromobacterium vaccinii TaxID=1108595 RepID=UPI000617F252|nr:hypothetical protein [Chromobacterium vaccinii]QND84827.1 Uncharacterized protein ChrSW_2601 [Chromobacterium vaccinii]QND90058.1 Uncharacterized protein ChrSV_2601 [Chromobacterium vaccinii]